MHHFTKLSTFVAAQTKRLARDESGATAIEYALIAAGISVVIIATVNQLGTTLNDLFFVKIADALK